MRNLSTVSRFMSWNFYAQSNFNQNWESPFGIHTLNESCFTDVWKIFPFHCFLELDKAIAFCAHAFFTWETETEGIPFKCTSFNLPILSQVAQPLWVIVDKLLRFSKLQFSFSMIKKSLQSKWSFSEKCLTQPLEYNKLSINISCSYNSTKTL